MLGGGGGGDQKLFCKKNFPKVKDGMDWLIFISQKPKNLMDFHFFDWKRGQQLQYFGTNG